MRRTIEALGGWIRVGPVLVVGIVLLWLSLAVTTNAVFARKSSSLAGAFGWSGAEARANEAQALVRIDAPPATLARAEALAQSALRRELLNGRAASTLGSVAALRQDVEGARRMFRFSEAITRRDLPTQLWLLEASVARGDAAGALRHYDRAMSVSVSSWNLLIPVLATAAAEPPIAKALAPRLKRRPNWWRAFVDQLISSNPAPAIAFPIILPALQLDPRNDIDRPYLVRAIEKLAKVGDYDEAWNLYRRATGVAAGARHELRDGGFDGENLASPFDWQLVDGEGLSAAIQLRESGGNGNALYLSADAGHTGDVARQLLLLGPGRYVLSGIVGGSALETDRPQVTIACARAEAPAGQLAQLSLPPANDVGRRFVTTFSVPAMNCPAQWLSIRAGAPLDTSAPMTWIDTLALRRS